MPRKKTGHTYKPGDIVALKSGSQRMVVVETHPTSVTCTYSNYETKEIMTYEVPVIALVRVTFSQGANQ